MIALGNIIEKKTREGIRFREGDLLNLHISRAMVLRCYTDNGNYAIKFLKLHNLARQVKLGGARYVYVNKITNPEVVFLRIKNHFVINFR